MSKDKYMKKKIIVVCVICILIFMNFYSLQLNNVSFSSEELDSEIVDNKAYKKVDNRDKTGYLTFGPYYKVFKGEVSVWIYYKTDSSDNTYDVYTSNSGQVLYSGKLDPSKDRVKLSVDMEDSDYLEVRTVYHGNGSLEVSKVEFSSRRDDLVAVIVIYDVIALIAICFYLKRVITKRNRK